MDGPTDRPTCDCDGVMEDVDPAPSLLVHGNHVHVVQHVADEEAAEILEAVATLHVEEVVCRHRPLVGQQFVHGPERGHYGVAQRHLVVGPLQSDVCKQCRNFF